MAISKIGRNATDTSISDSGDATAITISSAELVTVANGLTLTDGDVTVASGHGVSFGATSDASGSTSELFDDYEVGTWTPTLPSGGSLSATAASYTKIGRVVFCHCYLYDISDSSAIPNNSNTFFIGGLPFTVNNTSNSYTSIGTLNYSSGTDVSSWLQPTPTTNSTTFYFHVGNVTTVIKNSDVQSLDELICSVGYIV
tara:strand:- start:171 stop:767 length:597 start_codon:yes stop_codon:yes gene_type:complete